MKKFIKKYRSMTFEERTIFSTKFSCIFNTILAVGKILLSIFQGIFFLIAGIINILIMLSKLECYLGVTKPNKKSFEERNNMIGIYLILAGMTYAIYMGRLVFTNVEVMDYSMFLGISNSLHLFLTPSFFNAGDTARQIVFSLRSGSATTRSVVIGSRPRATHSTVA